MKKLKAYLVYRASDQGLRILRRLPGDGLAWDEVAFTVEVTVPDPWGRLAGAVLIELPENGPAVVQVQPEEIRGASAAPLTEREG